MSSVEVFANAYSWDSEYIMIVNSFLVCHIVCLLFYFSQSRLLKVSFTPLIIIYFEKYLSSS